MYRNTRRRSPFLISIGERAEKVRQAFENRLQDAREALAKLDEIACVCVEAEQERHKLKVDENTFAIYTIIKQAIDNLDVKQATTINAIYGNFPDYWWDARQEIDLRTELYATLIPITGSVEQTIEVTNNKSEIGTSRIMNAIPLPEKPQAQTKWKDAHELKEAVQQWGDRIKVQVKQIQLRPMKRKWGSISTTGNLTLNTELLDLPKELGEFVIVHELVHLLVPNHGKLLKCFMYVYLPDSEEREQRLQESVK